MKELMAIVDVLDSDYISWKYNVSESVRYIKYSGNRALRMKFREMLKSELAKRTNVVETKVRKEIERGNIWLKFCVKYWKI